jgi:hypothetical protein
MSREEKYVGMALQYQDFEKRIQNSYMLYSIFKRCLAANMSREWSEGAKIRADESNGNQTHVRKIHISGL